MMEFDESVFERKSCPEWARYAVIEKTGTVVFSSMPMFFSDGEWLCGNVYNRILIDVHGKKIFRKDFGELMLVRNVPEKVKPGDWVYFKGEKKYLQVEDKTGNTSEGFNLRCIDYTPATKIPLTAMPCWKSCSGRYSKESRTRVGIQRRLRREDWRQLVFCRRIVMGSEFP